MNRKTNRWEGFTLSIDHNHPYEYWEYYHTLQTSHLHSHNTHVLTWEDWGLQHTWYRAPLSHTRSTYIITAPSDSFQTTWTFLIFVKPDSKLSGILAWEIWSLYKDLTIQRYSLWPGTWACTRKGSMQDEPKRGCSTISNWNQKSGEVLSLKHGPKFYLSNKAEEFKLSVLPETRESIATISACIVPCIFASLSICQANLNIPPWLTSKSLK